MKSIYSTILLMIAVLTLHSAFAQNAKVDWQALSLAERAELLLELEYLNQEQLPNDTSVVSYNSLETITDQNHKAYVTKILSEFDTQVSREEIEQSEYQAHGDEQLVGLFLLVSSQNQILGALVQKYQDGRDQEGEEGDINWSASARFNSEGKVFSDENGNPVDNLYFEWSGH